MKKSQKKPKKKMPWKFVEVTWIDAVSTAEWLYDEKNFPKPAKFTTRGWLVQEEKDYITIAGTLGSFQDGHTFGEVLTLPRCWTKIKVIR